MVEGAREAVAMAVAHSAAVAATAATAVAMAVAHPAAVAATAATVVARVARGGRVGRAARAGAVGRAVAVAGTELVGEVRAKAAAAKATGATGAAAAVAPAVAGELEACASGCNTHRHRCGLPSRHRWRT